MGSNPWPPDHQSDAHLTKPTRSAQNLCFCGVDRKIFTRIFTSRRTGYHLNAFSPLPLSALIQQTTYWNIFLILPRKQDLTFHANWQFAWTVRSCFLGKIRKISSISHLLTILPRVLSVKYLLYKLYKICRTQIQVAKLHTRLSRCAGWSGYSAK